MYTHLNPTFIYKVKLGFTRVYIFLTIDPKCRLWVLIATAFNMPQAFNQCFEQKNSKYQTLSIEIFNFLQLEKINQRTNGPVNDHLSLLHIPINMFEYYGI